MKFKCFVVLNDGGVFIWAKCEAPHSEAAKLIIEGMYPNRRSMQYPIPDNDD